LVWVSKAWELGETRGVKIRKLSMKLCLEEQKSHLAILTLGEKV